MEKVAALKLDKDHETPEGEAVHISSFVIAKNGDKILMLRKPDRKNEIHWHLPARLLNYGEHPDDAAKEICKEWLGVNEIPKFVEVQTFLAHHWDICFVYEIKPSKVSIKQFKEYNFFDKNEMPWDDIGNSHADVIKALK